MEENYSSLKEEVEGKSKKLKTLAAKYRTMKSEMVDIQKEFEEERQGYIYFDSFYTKKSLNTDNVLLFVWKLRCTFFLSHLFFLSVRKTHTHTGEIILAQISSNHT